MLHVVLFQSSILTQENLRGIYKNPDLVLVDMKIIVEAPARFIVSGMGDVLATWFEAESCKAKYAGNMTGGVGSQSLTGYSRIVNLTHSSLTDMRP